MLSLRLITRELALTLRKPALTLRKLALTKRKPALIRDPAHTIRDSALTTRKPALTIREPAHTIREPAHTIREPAHTIREPAHTIREPAHTIREPAHTIREPAHTIRDPAHTIRDPAHTIRDPAHTIRDPALTTRKPALTLRMLALMWLAAPLVACTASKDVNINGSLRVTITMVDGVAPPSEAAPLPPNLGLSDAAWSFEVRAVDPQGNEDTSFNGFTRLKVVPGAVNTVEGPGAVGRNIKFENGVATGVANVTAVFGPARLWFEDIGYVPTVPGEVPACANGADDDGDVTADFPSDPGCAFADDNNEEDGTLLTGVSPPVFYDLPTLADVNGRGSTTPFPAVAVDIRTSRPSTVIVTRVSSNGFFVTDIGDPDNAYNHLFAFNFNTPAGMRVCNRLDLLTGTATEFFGFTEINFPSYEIGRVDVDNDTRCINDAGRDDGSLGCPAGQFCERVREFDEFGVCQPCMVPQPAELMAGDVNDDAFMETLESGLVTMEQLRISPNIGPENPELIGENMYAFTPNASNCDLDGDGVVDFFALDEAACANQCSASPECSEWTGFAARGNYKAHLGDAMIQLNTGTAQGFNPLDHKGQTFHYVTGNLRNFSGGSLNWTIETRCSDDLGCGFDEACSDVLGCLADCAMNDQACVDACNVPRDPSRACITPATESDNDAGTN